MFSALKKLLGIWTTNNSKECTDETPLFLGSAYFSNRVPRAFLEKWVEHGGEVSSGTTLDVQARYFFATDPSEPWVTRLFAKSVLVIHAGWITHCVNQAFLVPIAEYILDDRFVPEPPYKLISNCAPPIYVPLSDPGGPTDAEPTFIQTSDTPSTPTNMPRKRKREQAYFDSPSGFLVLSAFDKDGVPRRPRKQRRLRFDPSFSPEGGRSGSGAAWGASLDWLRDFHDASRSEDKFNEEHGRDEGPGIPRGYRTTVRSPDTPDKPLSYKGHSTAYRCPFVDEHLLEPAHVSSQAISIDTREKVLPVRTIDFTKLPPSNRRWRFPETGDTEPRDTDMTLSIVKSTDHKVRTPKKTSFANHARVCVYTVSPHPSNVEADVGVGCELQSSSKVFGNGPEVNGKVRVPSDGAMGSRGSAAEAIKDLVPGIESDPKFSDDFARLGDQRSENDTLTLTMEEVQAVRRRLLEAVPNNGAENRQLATLFELGKTHRGMVFRHVW